MAVYAGTIGLTINIAAGTNISSPGELKIRVRRPDGSAVDWSPTVDNGDAGTAHYVTTGTDLAQAGTYKLQSVWRPQGAGTTNVLYGEPTTLEVGARV